MKPIVIPNERDGSDPSDEAIFNDPRSGPWDGNWELDTIRVKEGELVVRFVSNMVEGQSGGVEISDNRLASVLGLRPQAQPDEKREGCLAIAKRTSRRLPPCDKSYLDQVEKKTKRDASDEAAEQCTSFCDGTYQTRKKEMKLKTGPFGQYCRYKCTVEYSGVCGE